MTSRPTYTDFQQGTPICVVGLGYVGLPLASALARKFRVIGFDINAERVAELQRGVDRTGELSAEQLTRSTSPASGGGAWVPVHVGRREIQHSGTLEFTTDAAVIASARLIIVTVPTPIDDHKNPDLTALKSASRMIGRHIARGTTVVYESTVYPGCTEEDCVPVIEKESELVWKADFFAGYSPERINPGDREHTVEKIKKVVSGDTPETAKLLGDVYGAVITAGIFVAESIKTAEAAKVIENTQRDLNIALMNELSLIFARMGLNTQSVLEAAGTKWNFMPFRPGLVGGHCIGVDPYYLTFKAETLGYHPQVILAGRRINDSMGKVVAEQTVKRLIAADRPVKGARVLVLGWTFKENVPDVRNTRVIDIVRELAAFGVDPRAFDPHADAAEVKHEYGIDLIQSVDAYAPYVAVVLSVKHTVLVKEFTLQRLAKLGAVSRPVLIDVKGFFRKDELEASGFPWWQL